MRPQRGASVAVVVLVAVVVNFPLAHSIWLDRLLARDGERVVATVTEAREVGEEFLLEVTIPASPRREEFAGAVARVDRLTFEVARDNRTVAARALPDDGGVFEVEGQLESRVGLIATLVADLFLLAIVALRLVLGSRPFDDDPVAES